MIYLKKNVGFWQFGDRLFLDVRVPLLFASIIDVHIYKYIRKFWAIHSGYDNNFFPHLPCRASRLTFYLPEWQN